MSPAGRPEIGHPINIRLGDELLSRVDAFAAREQISRAESLRQLVAAGLKKQGAGTATEKSVLRSGGQTKQYGPRPRIATTRPMEKP